MAATNGHADEGPPLTELESLQLKANQITDESLESTRRMITLCEDVSLVFNLPRVVFMRYYNDCFKSGVYSQVWPLINLFFTISW